MRKVKYYSLVEVLVVCSMIATMGAMIFVPFHKFNREFRQTALRNPQSAVILHMRQMLVRGVSQVKVFENRVEFVINEQSYFIPIPEGLTASVSSESDNKLLVLTLSDGKKQYYRMVGAINLTGEAIK